MRILVIDDNPQIRNVVARILRALGHDALECADGAAGIVAAEAPFALALIDVEMPGLNGFQTAAALPRHKGSRVIAMTGHDREAIAADLAAAGFDGCLHKPVDAAALVKQLTQEA